jgi:carbamoyltransferase
MKPDRPPNILGIFAIGPNPAACLLQGGELVAMAEEERFLRLKNIELHFPDRAIGYCLQQAGIGFEDVDHIAYAWDTMPYRGSIVAKRILRWITHNSWRDVVNVSRDEHLYKMLIGIAEVVFHHPALVRQRLRLRMKSEQYDLELPKVHFVSHHRAHAACTFYSSGFDRAAILTTDHNGEDNCTLLWSADGLDIEALDEYTLPHSLGWFYSGFTDYLGFIPEYQEGKTMGLAAHGQPDEDIARRMNQIMPLDGKQAYTLDPTYFFYSEGHGLAYSEKLVDLFGSPRQGPDDEIEQRYKDIAYGVQSHLEAALIRLVERVTELADSNTLCVAGGVGLNCSANGKVAASGLVNRIFIPPVTNDAGSALGAAMCVARELGYDPRFRMEHAYWGPGYSDAEIVSELDRMGLTYEHHEDIEQVVARHLAAGRTVAWFQGRMEIGPRALGARSLLGDPRSIEMRDRLNQIKRREPWRPLAPTMLEEACEEYLVGGRPSPFMLFTFPVCPEKQEVIPAVVHVDGTTRPQTVNQEQNPRLWRLVRAFEDLTGVPAVINTSFNVQSPIVCTVADAVETFYSNAIDELAIGSALLRK